MNSCRLKQSLKGFASQGLANTYVGAPVADGVVWYGVYFGLEIEQDFVVVFWRGVERLADCWGDGIEALRGRCPPF